MKSNGEGLKKFHSWWRRLGDRAEGRELGTLELGAHGCGKSFLAHTTTITNLKYNEHHKESVFLSAGSTGGDMQCSGDEAAQSQCCVQPFHFVSPPAPASQEGGSAPATDIKSTIFYCQKKFRSELELQLSMQPEPPLVSRLWDQPKRAAPTPQHARSRAFLDGDGANDEMLTFYSNILN